MTLVWRLRAAVLALVGLIAVHQGRYALVPRDHDHALGAAHAYLTWLIPLAAALLFVEVAQLAVTVRRPTARDAARLPRGPALWLAATGTILLAFGVQETAESYALHGVMPSPVELLAAGAWTAIPLAVVAGGVIALLLRGAAKVVRWALARARGGVRRRTTSSRRPPAPLLAPRTSVLARLLAGRAPPACRVALPIA